ncbi:MAG: DUF4071 domain-containing protein [Rhodocyclaceae bacterium]|nr:DUF4071 domain-containing protein [Rhodocyclaceae bacterium]
MKPLCFILMPFGRKPAGDGRIVDFDAVHERLIAPAVAAAGLEPLRADEEMTGGVIHQAMYERLVLCEFAVADLTTANANVFYELGLRHAARPAATQLLFANGWGQLPFDVNLLRAMPYALAPDGTPADPGRDAAALANRLSAARDQAADSPLYQMLDGFPDIQRLKTDVFRDRVREAADLKARLATARAAGLDAVRAVEGELGDVGRTDGSVVIDLFLSYRAVQGWAEMIALADRMAPPLAATVMVREQVALALNRAGRGAEAEAALQALIAERGASSETCGLLGRVYKDRWDAAVKAGDQRRARGVLRQAVDAYLQGFEADWRDAYPGVNAVTLMEMSDPPDPRQAGLLPVVAYAVERRIAQGKPDYWDHATRLELAVLAGNPAGAGDALAAALAAARERWEPESTARNLALIRAKRQQRGEDAGWIGALEGQLQARAAAFAT